MKFRSVSVNSNCFLLVDPTCWAGADIPVLVEIFRSIIEEFNYIVAISPQRQIIVQPDTGFGHPMCCKDGSIFLSARQNYWSKYVYQFAHEYCHFLIDGPLNGELETTFWLEESVCELASMVLLKRVTDRWLSWKTVPNVSLTDRDKVKLQLKVFAPHNISYLADLFKQNPIIDIPLSKWIDNNIAILSEPVHHRDMYNQIATVLYALFSEFPDLWKVIPFLYRPPKEDYSDFKSFITKTLVSRVNVKIEHLPVLIRCLTN